eukprot:scaffold3051_cov419-Prasinococcus_capsulatus_cf.AAC.5
MGEPQAPAEQIVTPWDVAGGSEGGIDYDRLVQDFGVTKISDELIARIERLTKKPVHPFLRRGVFFAHRDLKELLDLYEKGTPFYLYTGRGPSSEALHMGHLVPFMFTKYLQKTLQRSARGEWWLSPTLSSQAPSLLVCEQDAFKVPLVIQLTDDEKSMWKNISVEESQRLARENCKVSAAPTLCNGPGWLRYRD